MSKEQEEVEFRGLICTSRDRINFEFSVPRGITDEELNKLALEAMLNNIEWTFWPIYLEEDE